MFPRAAHEPADMKTRGAEHSLGRALAAIGLLEDAFVVARLTSLARRAILGADAFHLEATTYSAGTGYASAGHRDAQTGATYREPRVGFALDPSPFSVPGLWASPSSSCRGRLLRSFVMLLEEAGRLPLGLPLKEMVSLGGEPMVSEPCDEGEERLAESVRCGGGICWCWCW